MKEHLHALLANLRPLWEQGREDLKARFQEAREAAAKAARESTAQQKRRLALALAAVFLLCLLGLTAALFSAGQTPAPAAAATEETIYLRVAPGMSSKAIGEELEARGIIESPLKFWFVSKINGYDNQIKTGTYALHPGMEPRDVLKKLVNGETTRIKFTIPEGYRVRDIAKRLASEGIVDEQEFLKKAETYRPYDYIEQNDDAYYACEGFLFPDTYELRSDFTVSAILKEMSEDFDQRLTPRLRARAREKGLTIYELITFASLVEKEVRYEEDRPIVAQVFWKRLKIGMPLQSDTTFQYLRDDPKEDLTLADTTVDSPYNTYQHKGLPPGPIASPGMAAIEAVLSPADTDYLYFVADREGHNHYSKTYAEHQALVEEVR